MQREKVTVQPRTISGKAVKKLRREGIMPANVYGKDIESASVQLPLADFTALYKKVRETGLIDLALDGKTLPVLIHNVQRNPMTGDVIHADFFKVNLREKITSNIPVSFVGEPIAVKDKVGLLLTPLTEIEVEALPTDLPEKIEVNVENLAAIDDQITVGDISAPQGVTFLTDAAQVVAKIGELISAEAEAEAAAEEAAAEEAKAEGEGGEAPATEGEAAAESEKPAGSEEKSE
jgi:large subunit ribosomal protein L25